MDMQLLRHSVINDNIANAETPGFKARRVDFEQALQREVSNHNQGITKKLELSSIRPRVYEDPASETGLDRNSVDMEREMAQLSKNEIRYSATTEALKHKFSLLRYAISGGSDR